MLLTRGHGYVLEVLPGELDLDRFAEAAERGRDALATGRPADAARLLREALALWRGPPLAEFSYGGFAQAAIAQLEELHLAAWRSAWRPIWPLARLGSWWVSCAIWSRAIRCGSGCAAS